MATNRQKRIINLCERLYRAYGAAMDSDDDDAWGACDEAYEAIKAMLLPDEPELALDE